MAGGRCCVRARRPATGTQKCPWYATSPPGHMSSPVRRRAKVLKNVIRVVAVKKFRGPSVVSSEHKLEARISGTRAGGECLSCVMSAFLKLYSSRASHSHQCSGKQFPGNSPGVKRPVGETKVALGLRLAARNSRRKHVAAGGRPRWLLDAI